MGAANDTAGARRLQETGTSFAVDTSFEAASLVEPAALVEQLAEKINAEGASIGALVVLAASEILEVDLGEVTATVDTDDLSASVAGSGAASTSGAAIASVIVGLLGALLV